MPYRMHINIWLSSIESLFPDFLSSSEFFLGNAMGLSAKNMADLIVGLCLRDVRGGAPTKTRRTTSWAGKREGRLPPAGSQTTLQLSWHLSLHSSRIDEQTITAVCCVNEESTRGQSCSLPPVVLSVSQANFVVNLPENCSLFKASPRPSRGSRWEKSKKMLLSEEECESVESVDLGE
jgi:hypothetical protein